MFDCWNFIISHNPDLPIVDSYGLTGLSVSKFLNRLIWFIDYRIEISTVWDLWIREISFSYKFSRSKTMCLHTIL